VWVGNQLRRTTVRTASKSADLHNPAATMRRAAYLTRHAVRKAKAECVARPADAKSVASSKNPKPRTLLQATTYRLTTG